MLRRHDLIQKCQVIPESKDGFWLRDSGIGTKRLFEKRLSHRRHVLMRETHIGHGKERISRLHRLDANPSGFDECMTGNDLLDDIHWPPRLPYWRGERFLNYVLKRL